MVNSIMPELSTADVAQIQLDFDWMQYGKPFSMPWYLNREVYWLSERYCNLQKTLLPEWAALIDTHLNKTKRTRMTYRMRVCLAARELVLQKVIRGNSKRLVFSDPIPIGIEFLNPKDCSQQYAVLAVFRQLNLMDWVDYWYYLINENGGETAWGYLQDFHGDRVSIDVWAMVRERITKELVKMFGLPQ
jgi:hypothetical protein